MNIIRIFTDGACSSNPGPGGYSAVILKKQGVETISGSEIETTNNRMELFAIINSLLQLKEPCEVTLYSDSQYSDDLSHVYDNDDYNYYSASNLYTDTNLTNEVAVIRFGKYAKSPVTYYN